MDPVVLTCPIPPSTNNLHVNVPGRGRIKSKAYKAWITAAGWHVKLQRPPTLNGRVSVLIEARLSRRRDVDNLKAIPDLLQKLGVLANDNQIDQLIITRVTGDDICRVTITPLAE